MRKFFIVFLLLTLGSWRPLSAQLNKAYFYYMGRSLLIDNKYRDAIDVLNTLLRVDSTAADGYFLRGIAKYNMNDLLGAEQDFTRAIRQNPVYTMALQYRAITRSRVGNYDDALHDFQQAIELRPDLPGPYFSRGVTYLLSRQFEKAIDDFTDYIRRDSHSADAYINRGTCYLYLSDTTRALEDYERGIRTNYFDPNGYNRRGAIYLAQKRYDEALKEFDTSIARDSTFMPAWFNRAMVHSEQNRPVEAIADFTKVLLIDSSNVITYFNRAILRSQIGDYNRALEDYNKVSVYLPRNVLVYYNRAGVEARLGDYQAAIRDYSRAIDLYPDFANAYLNRSALRYALGDMRNSKSDKLTADRKIAEYRARLNDSTRSMFADTSRTFDQLLSFDSDLSQQQRRRQINTGSSDIELLPLFKFSLRSDTTQRKVPDFAATLRLDATERFAQQLGLASLRWTNQASTLGPDSLTVLDSRFADSLSHGDDSWQIYFKRAVTQSLIKQYTNSIASYTAAIDRNPRNAFLYINRSTTQSEMIDFISSLDNGFQSISVESDPASRMNSRSRRVYSYDEAIGDLTRAAQLMPDFAFIYYNRGNLYCRSGHLSEALEDYTRAVELDPMLGEAYYNRGLVQIYLEDTHKGCLDMSKAGELGVEAAYKVLQMYEKLREQ